MAAFNWWIVFRHRVILKAVTHRICNRKQENGPAKSLGIKLFTPATETRENKERGIFF